MNKYLCPSCLTALNVDNDVVLKAKNDLGQKGLVFLHSELGNYTTKFSSGFTIVVGDQVTLFCPVCHHNLTSLRNNKLASFIMVDEADRQSVIVFSKIYGERCTFKVEDNKVQESFGEHTGLYNNPDWFMFF
jgi:uncharacterized protein YbaR (Trm112 family)